MKRSDSSFEDVAHELAEQGFSVLQRAIPRDRLVELRSTCAKIVARSTRARMRVPLELLGRAPFRGGLATMLPSVREVLLQTLGAEPSAIEYWIRTSPPGSRQAVHRDRRNPGPGTAPAFSVDVALTDVTEQNGGTELWPGSHRIFDPDEASLRAAARRALGHRSVRLVMPEGSVAIRDLRLWHRAMPNRTSEQRLILSVTVVPHAAS